MQSTTWEIASSVATVVQAIGVVLTLFFIWRQIQQQTLQAEQQTRQIEQQTELAKIANTQALVGLSSPLNLELIKDARVAEFWIKGAEKFAGYDDIDKYRYKSLLIWWLILHENIFYQYKKNLLDEGIYAAWNHDLKLFVKQHDLKLHWAELSPSFQSEFRNHVGTLVDSTAEITV